jgi:2,4-dienoyl-CoA reductase-like NADH-dependent reductase (Old Yellow Enzyme family)
MTKPILFTPIQIGDLTLKNRVFISPMATYMGQNGKLTDWHLGHIGRLALGGAGMVMVEATAVTYEGQVGNGDSGL